MGQGILYWLEYIFCGDKNMKSRSTLSKQINNIIFKSLYYAALIGILVYILLLEVHNFNYEAIATYYEE